MLIIKIQYIQKNPTRGDFKSVNDCTDYYFSSAKAYASQASNFQFLSLLKIAIPWH